MITNRADSFWDNTPPTNFIDVDDPQKHRALKACGPLFVVLFLVWLCYYTRKDLFPEKGSSYVVLAGLSFSVTSISMHTLNKVCVSLTSAPGTVTITQMLIAVVAIMAVQYREVLAANRQQMLRWCWVPLVYAAMLNSSLFGYEYLSLCLVTVFRNLAPLVTMAVERLIMPPEHQPQVTGPILMALLSMVAGAILFSYSETKFSWLGLGLVVLNCLIAIFDRLLQRRLLVLECKDLPLSACMAINNTVGILPSILVTCLLHEYSGYAKNNAVWSDPAVIVLLIMSGLMGLGIGFFGLMCQKAMTATSFQVLQNMSKVAVVFMGVSVFGDKVDSPARIGGMILSLAGSLIYGLIRHRDREKCVEDDEKKSLINDGRKRAFGTTTA